MFEAFLGMKSADPNVTAAGSRLAESMRLLSFVVPGLMLGVAVNLITVFLQAPPPRGVRMTSNISFQQTAFGIH